MYIQCMSGEHHIYHKLTHLRFDRVFVPYVLYLLIIYMLFFTYGIMDAFNNPDTIRIMSSRPGWNNKESAYTFILYIWSELLTIVTKPLMAHLHKLHFYDNSPFNHPHFLWVSILLFLTSARIWGGGKAFRGWRLEYQCLSWETQSVCALYNELMPPAMAKHWQFGKKYQFEIKANLVLIILQFTAVQIPWY